MDLKETEIKSDLKYDGEIIRVEQETVRLANGEITHRDVVHHAEAVAMLVITDDNKIILEKQWREPAKAVLLEIPAGKLDERDKGNEMHAVQRELNEEIRYDAKLIRELYSFYTSAGFADEYMYPLSLKISLSNVYAAALSSLSRISVLSLYAAYPAVTYKEYVAYSPEPTEPLNVSVAAS